MTYLQSLKQFNDLRHTIIPFNCEVIFFDFKSLTEYQIVFFDKYDLLSLRKLATQKLREDLPCGIIVATDKEFSFDYRDINIDCEFDLNTDQLTFFESDEGRRKPSKAMLLLEFAKLKKILSQL